MRVVGVGEVRELCCSMSVKAFLAGFSSILLILWRSGSVRWDGMEGREGKDRPVGISWTC